MKHTEHLFALACALAALKRGEWPVGCVVELRTVARPVAPFNVRFVTHCQERVDLVAP